jgi:hypothetical protein
MAAIQGINVIKGKPTASASLIASLVRMAGHRLRVTSNGKEAVCEIYRKDDQDYPFISVWNLDRAKTAGLLSNPSWQKYPDAMMKARAITECARDACPEVLAGVQYTEEELTEPKANFGKGNAKDPWDYATPKADVIEGEVVEDAPSAE